MAHFKILENKYSNKLIPFLHDNNKIEVHRDFEWNDKEVWLSKKTKIFFIFNDNDVKISTLVDINLLIPSILILDIFCVLDPEAKLLINNKILNINSIISELDSSNIKVSLEGRFSNYSDYSEAKDFYPYIISPNYEDLFLLNKELKRVEKLIKKKINPHFINEMDNSCVSFFIKFL